MTPRFCTVNVPVLCGKQAVEVLIVREFPWSEERVHYRCPDHPARDWITIVKRAFPMAEARVERTGNGEE